MSKNGHISHFFFLGNKGQENVFYDILERKKNAFLGFKNKKVQKVEKLTFLKGLTDDFGPKIAIFPIFFLGNIGQEDVFYDILERKNAFLGYKKPEVENVKKMTIFLRGKPMLLVQKWLFLQLFFLGNIGQENVFYDILEQKNAFLGYKNKKFKNSKN